MQDFDWDIEAGEVHCLIGENGSGKSTAIKLLAGINRPEPGTGIEVGGRRFARLSPHLAKSLGIHVIYQDLSLFPNLSVADNIAIDEALDGWWRPISRRRSRRRAVAAVRELGIELPFDVPVGDLPIGTRQLVAIGRGLADRARLLILDEPTASLTRAEVDALLAVLRGLKQQGISIVFVSHRLDEIVEIADRVTVLRDGRKVGTFPASGLDDRRLAELMTGQRIEHQLRARERQSVEPLLEVIGLTRRGEYEDVHLSIAGGEIVGLVGLLGAGRTELALSLFGMSRPDSGEIRLAGKTLRLRSNSEAIEAGIAYVSEDRLTVGLNLRQSVLDNMVLAVLHRLVGRFGWIAPSRRLQVAAEWRGRLQIKLPSLAAPVSQLSGGNQQRVVLAKWLSTRPRLLILDSPTVGVDIGNKQGIYDIVRRLADEGVAVLMISDEVPEVYFNCDRVLHMRAGRLVGTFLPDRDSEESINASVYA